jgi:hypothetical protein
MSGFSNIITSSTNPVRADLKVNDLDVLGNFGVSGSSEFQNLFINGTLGVAGGVTMEGLVDVIGSARFQDDVNIDEELNVGKDIISDAIVVANGYNMRAIAGQKLTVDNSFNYGTGIDNLYAFGFDSGPSGSNGWMRCNVDQIDASHGYVWSAGALPKVNNSSNIVTITTGGSSADTLLVQKQTGGGNCVSIVQNYPGSALNVLKTDTDGTPAIRIINESSASACFIQQRGTTGFGCLTAQNDVQGSPIPNQPLTLIQGSENSPLITFSTVTGGIQGQPGSLTGTILVVVNGSRVYIPYSTTAS